MQRSDALRRYEILNTPPEPNFDRLTRIASSVLQRPVCTLALADRDRFWLKSKQGVDVTELPRSMAFCEETIRGEDVFVVLDAFQDCRFADAPLVKNEPHLRFYAGAPLLTPSGTAIGSLCVLDEKPETDFPAESRQLLQDLASTAVELFEARARQIEVMKCTSEIAYLARHDSLTDLPNRRKLAETFGAIAREGNSGRVALLYLDLDGFKTVNDTHGHARGDALLRRVADRIRACLPPEASVARLGGDEFVVLLPASGEDLTEEAAFLARRLMASIARPYDSGELRLMIGCSIGIAIGQHAASIEDLLARADETLYRVKTEGRGRYLFHDGASSLAALCG
jgi:diguanylate cyclase (GGDEF)-like protein